MEREVTQEDAIAEAEHNGDEEGGSASVGRTSPSRINCPERRAECSGESDGSSVLVANGSRCLRTSDSDVDEEKAITDEVQTWKARQWP